MSLNIEQKKCDQCADGVICVSAECDDGGPCKDGPCPRCAEQTKWGKDSTSIWEQELEMRSVNAVYASGLVISTQDAILYFRQLLDAHATQASTKARTQALRDALMAVESTFFTDSRSGVRQTRTDLVVEVIRSLLNE